MRKWGLTAARIQRFPTGRQSRGHDEYQDGPADVIPFGPRAPRTPLEPPRSAKVVGGRLIKRRTWTPGLSMTLSIDVEELAHALVALSGQRAQQSATTHQRSHARRRRRSTAPRR
jgi:hypothetical protein